MRRQRAERRGELGTLPRACHAAERGTGADKIEHAGIRQPRDRKVDDGLQRLVNDQGLGELARRRGEKPLVLFGALLVRDVA